ncbi:abortive phage resistance protein [Mixta calida]|uniref:AbiTii domain-containing protein n=1 Tax=Mixta calida TaxID=665913 RepID=UPI0029073FCF|nr:abortive phage resistance protein [Mixta calida]MDU4291470.1 abortive phage resistance protein [Mixta calida]
MSSPVLQLQELAENPSSDLTALLFKAKSIASKLNLPDLAEWVDHETNGYSRDSDIPDYRIGRGIIKVRGGLQTVYTPLELTGVPADIVDMITTFKLSQSVSSMQGKEAGETCHLRLPPKKCEIIFGKGEGGTDACWFFSSDICTNIITTVRSKIHNWALELERKGILGDGLRFSQVEKEVAPVTINNNFHGVFNNNGVFANQAHDINQQNTITTGDFSALSTKLKEHGIDDADISELKEVIDQSPQLQSKEQVETVFGGWLGKMIGKAYSGTVKIAGTAAPVLLTNYLCHHYGIPV